MQTDEKLNGLDLADYKAMELETTNQIRSAEVMIATSQILLTEAIRCIKVLGGLTIEEEDAKAKKLRENDTNPNEPDTE